MPARNREREQYVYHARKFDKRTYADIGRDLGITGNRVRQIYVRIDWELNRYNADHHLKDKKNECDNMENNDETNGWDEIDEIDEFTYRLPMTVNQSNVNDNPVCPRCGKSLLRYQQKFCNHCGQKLAWNNP